MSADTSEINLLLDQYRSGQSDAFERLMSLVYDDLRKIAAWQLKTERSDHTLQPTALVHEVYLRLLGQNPIEWQNKKHFFALATQVMRHILVDHARTRLRDKRSGEGKRVALEEVLNLSSVTDPDLVELDDVLSLLAEKDQRKSRIVELRYFGGLSIEETAEVLGISVTTVKREWTMAKAWLRREMHKDRSASSEN
ncbi:MAG: sigma-70 family RNA polymerase sigma factor [Acidobacteria bacterium]|nr:sigma-70 family RNA polymerase sigma factor [Acidobacteriota bacterium]